MLHGCQTLYSSGSGVYSLGRLVSVNATTPRASRHALTGLYRCYQLPHSWHVLELFDLSHCIIVPHNTMKVTRRKVSDHHHASKHTRVPQDLQPAQLT